MVRVWGWGCGITYLACSWKKQVFLCFGAAIWHLAAGLWAPCQGPVPPNSSGDCSNRSVLRSLAKRLQARNTGVPHRLDVLCRICYDSGKWLCVIVMTTAARPDRFCVCCALAQIVPGQHSEGKRWVCKEGAAVRYWSEPRLLVEGLEVPAVEWQPVIPVWVQWM